METNRCNAYDPPFFGYAPTNMSKERLYLEPVFFGYGIGSDKSGRNVDIETDLRGLTRPLSKCAEKKYRANLKSDEK